MSTLTEKELEELREKLLNKIEEHVLKFHVSFGKLLGLFRTTSADRFRHFCQI